MADELCSNLRLCVSLQTDFVSRQRQAVAGRRSRAARPVLAGQRRSRGGRSHPRRRSSTFVCSPLLFVPVLCTAQQRPVQGAPTP